MRFHNPCKLCLVKACCINRCPDRQEYWDTGLKTINAITALLCWTAVIVAVFSIMINR